MASRSSSRKRKKENPRVQVYLTKEQLKRIKKYDGVLGDTESEIIRTIVANWLVEMER